MPLTQRVTRNSMELPFILDAEALTPEQQKALEHFQEQFRLQCIERRLDATREG